MKKFYTSVVSVLILFITVTSSKAQFLGGTYTMLPTGGSTSNPANWVGGIPPGNPCLNCHIILNGPVTMDFHDATMNITSGTSQLDITAGSTVNVNEYVELFNTKVIIANNATVNINDEVHLVNSSITLNNTGSVINSNNAIHNPSHGTVDPGDDAGAGIYYNYTGVLPLISTSPFDYLISPFGYGKSGTVLFDPYTINCDPTQATTPACASGFVYGPATTAFSITDGTWEFVQSTPLPVTLTQFTAILNPDKSVNVLWTTSEEVNSDFYDVERSADASKWISLGQVKARGSSAVDVNYSFRDPSPNPGINYYRLKMVDLDGKFGYSKIASVNLNGGGPKLVIYSNPFTDAVRLKVNLDAQDQLLLTLSDATGKVYTRQTFNGQTGDNYINLYPTGASDGMYILNINGNTISQTIKLIKQ